MSPAAVLLIVGNYATHLNVHFGRLEFDAPTEGGPVEYYDIDIRSTGFTSMQKQVRAGAREKDSSGVENKGAWRSVVYVEVKRTRYSPRSTGFIPEKQNKINPYQSHPCFVFVQVSALQHSRSYTFKARSVGPADPNLEERPKSDWSAECPIATAVTRTKGDGFSNMSNKVGSWQANKPDVVKAEAGVCQAFSVQ